MKKYRIVKRDGLWFFSRPGCPAGMHFCLGSLFNLFTPDHCGSAASWEAAMKKFNERARWERLEHYRLMAPQLNPVRQNIILD